MIDYSKLPEHMQEATRAYIEDRRPPGGFLQAVLANDFVMAASRADDINQRCLFDWASFLYNEAPVECWGSPEAVYDWVEGRTE